MSANTRRERNEDLAKLASLYAQAVTMIEKGKRSPTQISAFMQALQFFKENRLLAAVPKPPKDTLPQPEQLQQLFSIRIAETDINRVTATLLRKRGFQYVGELFMVAWGSSDTGKTVENFLRSIDLVLGLDLDEIGWVPPYADKNFFWLMNQPTVLFMKESSFQGSYPHNWFSKFQYVGELFQTTTRHWFSGSFNLERFSEVMRSDTKLRAGLYCPKSWTPPPDPPK